MTTPEIIIIITTSSGAMVTVINAIASGWSRKVLVGKAEEASGKLDVIHQLTNSNLTSVQGQLKAALDRITRLEELLTKKENGH